MSAKGLRWIAETAPRWDEHKKRIVGDAPEGTFDPRYRRLKVGELLPGEWWRVERDGEVAGYGWLDVVWGDAEILLAAAPGSQTLGVGSFILEKLESEARARGLNYLYNVVPPTHPRAREVTAWLERRGFRASEDGRLLRAVVRVESKGGAR